MKYVIFALLTLIVMQGVTAHTAPANFVNSNYTDTAKPLKTKPPLTDTVRTAKDSTIYDSTRPSSDKVQVKGYYRKNGTYVQPYSRSKPKSHH